ncbi:hypothetical protein AMATHDRAFT_59742 [Amanita thiersii Skay4041]|uniref:Uncharacterized protein n=1 Tax=Amanita thiersii Skay4041 TaxID=703135 RepID=A0A2A9NP15_9AGAR|nr:hypothetical protein AMATHDRAFT_59742 [Amanita thiersii Skay4041]
MSTFQALMALSASQTKEAQSAVQVALQERQRKEAAKRKEQEERERKEQERERQLRLKKFEQEKKEQERVKREEDRRKAMEAALQRREDEQRNALLYGPKKGNKWPSSTSGAKEAVRKSRLPADVDDGEPPAGSFLTREELRQRKQEAERRRLYGSTRRTSGGTSYSKHGKRLPGGAVDVATPTRSAGDPGTFKSVKDRLAAEPITLTRLNVNKRDTRTIDEIVQDRAKAKVLDGDKAREFNDWFSTSKKDKKEGAKKVPSPGTTTTTTSAAVTAQGSFSSVTSGANTPVSRGTPGPNGSSSGSSAKAKSFMQSTKSVPMSSSKSALGGKASLSTSTYTKSLSQPTSSKNPALNGKIGKMSSSQPAPKSNYGLQPMSKSLSSVPKKRHRSESRSESPAPKKRASAHVSDDDDAPDNLGSVIWSIFGRNRDSYVGIDVYSDDEDMEADATTVAREEAFRFFFISSFVYAPSILTLLVVPASLLGKSRLLSRKSAVMRKRNGDAERSEKLERGLVSAKGVAAECSSLLHRYLAPYSLLLFFIHSLNVELLKRHKPVGLDLVRLSP